MQLTVGTVVDGKIVVEGDPLPEGAVVTILAREADETFEVPPELEAGAGVHRPGRPRGDDLRRRAAGTSSPHRVNRARR